MYPTEDQVLEDLRLLAPHFDYLRMYDTSEHAESVLRVIERHRLPLKVMLGTEPLGEISNPNCPWGGLHSPEEIQQNREENIRRLQKLAFMAGRHSSSVLAVSVGNENTSDWHPNLMPAETLAEHVRILKSLVSVPVTFCEGGYFWREKGESIAREVDFISIHSYPLWHRIPLKDAVEYTVSDYQSTVQHFPGKPVIFTEYGWTTQTNQQMDITQVGEFQQSDYLQTMFRWSRENTVTMFLFEAFDEPWKGGNDPTEPEKHWGIYREDRSPKPFVQETMNH
jgi:exo-beta-1,3-glucanase (GH17 family)